jgi:hypothetical protein
MDADAYVAGHGGKCCGRTREGPPCRNAAGYKTGHVGVGRCHIHGGNTPTHVAAALRQQASELVGRTLLGGPGVEPVKDPVAFAQRLLGQLGHAVEMLDWLLGSVTDGDGGPVELSEGQRATFAALSPILREARQLSEGLARLRLGERLVELDAERLQLVRVALGRAIAAAELEAGQRSVLLRVLAAELRVRGRLEIEDGSQ